ncbi:hypothetical protein RFI_16721 [Reticulomyxa filosa]|uniref:Uncharacterized protein n=1 Tax=Reticulomyxa filosa TaxID=46433 RepID=X6N2K7_RETFI|nr:hypothetical protein RFI_16721 [Reticulomyxa filosa]|eukprot:ETO20495.1 hypothetical protein RFI_16721 [Reticulomyxa filosa]
MSFEIITHGELITGTFCSNSLQPNFESTPTQVTVTCCTDSKNASSTNFSSKSQVAIVDTTLANVPVPNDRIRRNLILAQLTGNPFEIQNITEMLTTIQCLLWIIYGFSQIKESMWWSLILTVSVIMCCIGFKGAIELKAKYLQYYQNYLISEILFSIVAIIIFIAHEYVQGIISQFVALLSFVYCAFVVNDFIFVIELVDGNTTSQLNTFFEEITAFFLTLISRFSFF